MLARPGSVLRLPGLLPGGLVMLVLVVFVFVARFRQVVFQLLLRVPPALSDCPHLPCGWCRVGMQVGTGVPLVPIMLVAHNSMLPLTPPDRKGACTVQPVRSGRSRAGHPVAGAFSGPPQRCHLHLHAPPAGTAIARGFQREVVPAAKVGGRRRPCAAVERVTAVPAEGVSGGGVFPGRGWACGDTGFHRHRVFWSSLMGMFSSTKRSRSAVAGRPSVVR